ncbi:FMN-binding negative transcriptional regulator [Mucilaginibacter pallidiroseus]|uniref:FMN-binding negative transcriptional regulator n=1 Tax=Mucilaginibacter pallidiroseus TaxID=2599295 RepID=A0A563UIU0_9SPHI|nr:FMN-binding negative transcriptional regulator [Mucilaginibacter pallidiroseus]TWR31219.1 FMN-binding negative transcriptional regulator [Mucilaginibacter pallidiroseus]
MYTPKHFQITGIQDSISFMQKYSFATIVTVKDGLPTATHLPFIVEEHNGGVILTSHFAKANQQSEDVLHCVPLVIFTEPHAYISTKNYEKELNVPTWNYLAVHAYGTASLIDAEEKVMDVLEKMIGFYEPDYLNQWNNLPQDYQAKMINGIVAFEIKVTDLQGKKKLSQNRTAVEQQNIIDALSKSTDFNEQQIAAYMANVASH